MEIATFNRKDGLNCNEWKVVFYNKKCIDSSKTHLTQYFSHIIG